MYQPRTYRHWIKSQDLVSFNVVVKETDLHIQATTNLRRKAARSVPRHRNTLERYIERQPSFLTSLEPLDVGDDAPQIIKAMAKAARLASVGPMAAVAGAIAEFVGYDLLPFSPEIIIENGGDIFLKTTRQRQVGIYAGQSSLSGKIALEIEARSTPLGICTSSGTVGYSLSYGKADAVIVLSRSTPLADAAATAIGNRVNTPDDVQAGIEFAQSIEGILGVVIIKDDNMGLWGEVKISRK